jgi:hypothetical protein
MTGEQRLTKMFKEGLRGQYLFKVWGSAFQKSGMPDFYVVINGVQGWVELKAGKREVEPLQRVQMGKLKWNRVPCSVIRLVNDGSLQVENESGDVLDSRDLINDWKLYVLRSWELNGSAMRSSGAQ